MPSPIREELDVVLLYHDEHCFGCTLSIDRPFPALFQDGFGVIPVTHPQMSCCLLGGLVYGTCLWSVEESG